MYIDMATEMVIDGYVLVWEKHSKKTDSTRLGNWKFIEDSTRKNSNNNSYTRLDSPRISSFITVRVLLKENSNFFFNFYAHRLTLGTIIKLKSQKLYEHIVCKN